ISPESVLEHRRAPHHDQGPAMGSATDSAMGATTTLSAVGMDLRATRTTAVIRPGSGPRNQIFTVLSTRILKRILRRYSHLWRRPPQMPCLVACNNSS